MEIEAKLLIRNMTFYREIMKINFMLSPLRYRVLASPDSFEELRARPIKAIKAFSIQPSC